MDDLDRLFRLMDLVTDPKTAKANTDKLKELREQEKANKAVLAEANLMKTRAAEARKAMDAEQVKLDKAYLDIREEKKTITLRWAEINNERKASQAEITKRRNELKAEEDESKKRVSALKAQIGDLEASVASLKALKAEAESEIERVKNRL